MLSAIWKRLMVPPPGHKQKARLCGPSFLLYRDFGSGGYGAPGALNKGHVSDFQRFHFATEILRERPK